MAGRRQKYVAATVAAWGVAGAACAQELREAFVPAPRIVAGEIRWAGDDAQGRWSLVADARRSGAADESPNEAARIPGAALAARHALITDAASGGLTFEAQRWISGIRLETAAFASRAAVSTRDDAAATEASLDTRTRSRFTVSRFGFSGALVDSGRWAGIPWTRSALVRAGRESFGSRALRSDAWSGADTDLARDEAAETRASLEVRQAFDLAPGWRLAAANRFERFRTATGRLGERPAARDGFSQSPSMQLDWRGLSGVGFSGSLARGPLEASRNLLAIDPLNARRLDALDPSQRTTRAEIGTRVRVAGIDARISGWRDEAPAALAFGDRTALVTERAVSRHGIALGFGYSPLAALDLRADAVLDAARMSDGPRLPGAPRVFGSAGATVRMSRDLDARLFVSYLGPRQALEEGELLHGTTLANFQVVRWLGRTTRVSLDVFNVFDQRVRALDSLVAARTGLVEGMGESFLAAPGEPRGVLLKFRTRF